MELLTRSAGALACEAAFGWLELPELSEEAVQSAQATAASFGAAFAKRKADAGTATGTGAGGRGPKGSAPEGAASGAKFGKDDHSEGSGQLRDSRSADQNEDQQDQEDEQQFDQGADAMEYDGDQARSEDGNRQQEEYNAQYDDADPEQQGQEYDMEAYNDQQDEDAQDQEQQYNGDSRGNEAYDEEGDPDREGQQEQEAKEEGADNAEQAGDQADQWDVPERGAGKLCHVTQLMMLNCILKVTCSAVVPVQDCKYFQSMLVGLNQVALELYAACLYWLYDCDNSKLEFHLQVKQDHQAQPGLLSVRPHKGKLGGFHNV